MLCLPFLHLKLDRESRGPNAVDSQLTVFGQLLHIQNLFGRIREQIIQIVLHQQHRFGQALIVLGRARCRIFEFTLKIDKLR